MPLCAFRGLFTTLLLSVRAVRLILCIPRCYLFTFSVRGSIQKIRSNRPAQDALFRVLMTGALAEAQATTTLPLTQPLVSRCLIPMGSSFCCGGTPAPSLSPERQEHVSPHLACARHTPWAYAREGDHCHQNMDHDMYLLPPREGGTRRERERHRGEEGLNASSLSQG